nr:hypothetical protein BaRGS_008977 [Batillaria attramentaria]
MISHTFTLCGLFDAHNPYSRYDCNNLLGTRVIDTFVIEQQCLLGHDAYVFTVVEAGRPEDFQYDLFVSYDSEDCDWVLNHLMPVLEQQMALRLCVHQRDFIPGKNITDNIVDSLAASKRVLALFSPSFAESQWCQFELELCLSHVVDNDDVMVVVILEHVPARDMSGAMMALLKTTTYIEWEHGQEAEASFWRRMTLALNDILPGCRQ